MPVSRGARAPRRRRRARRAHAHSPGFTVVARLLRSLRRGYGTPPSAWYSGYLNPAGTTKHMCVPDRARAKELVSTLVSAPNVFSRNVTMLEEVRVELLTLASAGA